MRLVLLIQHNTVCIKASNRLSTHLRAAAGHTATVTESRIFYKISGETQNLLRSELLAEVAMLLFGSQQFSLKHIPAPLHFLIIDFL